MAKIADMGGWFGGPQADVGNPDNDAITVSPYAPEPYFERSVPYITPADTYVAPIGGGGGGGAPQWQQPAVQQNTPTYGIGAPTGGGYGGAPIPQPQSKPVMSEPDWLAGDSSYQNQMTQLNGTLADFLARLTRQRSDFQSDYDTANKGLDRTRQMGMLNLGEDMTSRGLGNSGLFQQQREILGQNYQNQQNALNTGRDRGMADFDLQQSDKQKSTQQALDNAKQESLSRRAAQMMF